MAIRTCWSSILILSIFFFFVCRSLADPRIELVELQCGNKTNTTSFPTFTTIMRPISDQVSNQNWGYDSVPGMMYGLSQCHGDLNRSDCLLCFGESRTKLPRCLPNVGGRIYLDGCFLRYDSYNFFYESTDPDHDNFKCTARGTNLTEARSTLFQERVGRVLRNVTSTAAANNGYAVVEEEDPSPDGLGAYAIAQCWQTVSESGCRACLEDAASKVKGCVPGIEGRAMNAGCFLRYSTRKFYQATLPGGSSNREVIVVSALLCTAAFSLVIIGVFIGGRKLADRRRARRNAVRLPGFMRKSNLNFKYETLEKATNFFNNARKLGQGGAGSVYKGILPDGRVVAVKRLVYNTREWVHDFFNEVNLINGIRHENLVGLLGCSIEGPESLLVYEYVPNRSLDQILFDKHPIGILNWHDRLRVITGTAEGLAFLHSGSFGLKIIHRDIKTSNILLDENLTAKIADFGLVRCLAPDRSHLTTGIAGTLGYMAPEYLVRGQLTEKADVYSFGVLVLEILTGRKNSTFDDGLGSVLQTVWRDYKSNRLHESMDTAFRGDFPIDEAANVLRIGLLCTQASPELRPWMTEVVQMLNDKHAMVPAPNQPPFLNASVLSSGSSTGSSSAGVSNRQSEISSSNSTMSSERRASVDSAEKWTNARIVL